MVRDSASHAMESQLSVLLEKNRIAGRNKFKSATPHEHEVTGAKPREHASVLNRYARRAVPQNIFRDAGRRIIPAVRSERGLKMNMRDSCCRTHLDFDPVERETIARVNSNPCFPHAN